MAENLYLLIILWTGVIYGGCLADYNDTAALTFPRDQRLGPEHYLRIIHIEEHFLLIGGRDTFYNVSTVTMELVQQFGWSASQQDLASCHAETVKFDDDCFSYVRSAFRANDSYYFVCASSAKKARCRALTHNQTGWTLGSENVKPNDAATFILAPVFPWNEMRLFRTSDTKILYIASHQLDSAVWVPLIFKGYEYNPATGERKNALRSSYDLEFFSIDYTHEKTTEFKGIFEDDDHVFTTYFEPAMESRYGLSLGTETYARITRVCKNDKGRGNLPSEANSQYKFATLYKARMLCGNSALRTENTQKYFKAKLRGYYASYIHEIADSSIAHVSSVAEANGEKIVFAIFNSPSNAPHISAICAYKVSDINRIFDTSPHLSFANSRGEARRLESRGATKCRNDTRIIDDTIKDLLREYLLAEPVTPLGNNTLFFSGLDYRMTRMVVDWQVEAADGKKYDVIFVSTDNGRLVKMVKYANHNEGAERYHIVDERIIFPGQHIHEMELIHDEWGKKHLVLNTFSQIKRVAIEKCHFSTNCSSCIAKRDPYCSWSPSLSRCVSTTHEATDKYQNISYGKSEICEPVIENNTIINEETLTTSGEIEKVIADGNVAEVSRITEYSNGLNTTFITLIVILPILFGVLAFFAGYLISKRRYMSPTPHLDHELSKSKTNVLNSNANCDAYQTLPNKPSNLQLVNNLNGKVPNIDTTSMGEMTLQRTKKVYV